MLAARGRPGAGARRRSTPLVGRGPELALLEEHLERVLRERSARLVTVLGAPGVGKSRLGG